MRYMTEEGWGKSSYSNDWATNDCIEVRPQGGVQVRDSKNKSGGQLKFDRREWGVFLDRVKTDTV